MTTARLLVLASTYPAIPGDGTPSFVRDLALSMSADFETLVLVPAVPGAPKSETTETNSHPVRVQRYRFFIKRWEDLAQGAILENVRARKSRLLQVPLLLISQWWNVRRAVKSFEPDVILAHWIIPQGITARYAAKRVPKVVTTMGGDLYALQDTLSIRLKRSVVRNAHAVAAMNEDMRQQLIALGAAPERAVVAPMGADLAVFSPIAQQRFSAAQVSVESAATGVLPVRILAIGRLVEKKGFTVLLSSLRTGISVPWELTIVGDGPLKAELVELAAGLPVTFAGQLGRADLSTQYAEHDLAVFPSQRAASGDQDGLPVAMLEAMGSGLPIVASNLPGLAEVVREGAGIVVEPGDPEALGRAIDDLAADPSARRDFGEAAAEIAHGHSIEAVSARYTELVTAAISARQN